MHPFKLARLFWLLLGISIITIYSCGPDPVDNINFLIDGQNPDGVSSYDDVDTLTVQRVKKDTLVTFADQSTPEGAIKKRSWFVNGTLEQSGSQTVFEYTFTDLGQQCIRLCLNDQETDDYCILKCLLVEEPELDPFGDLTDSLDTDFDGITDDIDLCPEEYGYEEFAGCPDEQSYNEIANPVDDPPFTDDPFDGPTDGGDNVDPPVIDGPTDRDNDGVLDAEDKCPDTKGTVDNDGCPPKIDSDGDGVPDDFDDCKNEFGLVERNGCPAPPITVDDLNGTKTIGLQLPAASESCLEMVEAAVKVTLRPQEHIQLRSFNMIASGCGRVQINLRGSDGVKEETIRTVTEGRNTINMADYVVLLAQGKSYTLTLTPLKTPSCPTPDVSLADAKNCNLAARSSAQLKLANATAIFDIQYAYKK